jgi:hypothetical protein
VQSIAYSGVYFLSEETEFLLPVINSNNVDYIVKKEILSDILKPAHSSNDRSGYLIYKSDHKIILE